MAVSCDADGLVVMWDLQSGQALLEVSDHEQRAVDCLSLTSVTQVDIGPHSATTCAMDTSGAVIAIGSSDSAVRVIDISAKAVVATVGRSVLRFELSLIELGVAQSPRGRCASRLV